MKDFVDIGKATLRITTIAACLGVLPVSALAHGGNKMDSEYLYEIKNYQTKVIALPPQTFKIGGLFGGYNHISIFPVPQDNAIGSNDMGNAITIISFPKGKISYGKIKGTTER